MIKLFFSLILLPASYAHDPGSGRVDNLNFIEFYIDTESNLRINLIPCEDSKTNQTTLLNSTDLPRHTQNPYYVVIKKTNYDAKEAEVTLSSGATLYYDNEHETYIPITNLTFAVILPRGKTFSFLIERTKPAVLPYVTNLKIDGKEYCKEDIIDASEPREDLRRLDEYIERYKEFEQITIPVHDNVCGTRKVGHIGLIVNGFPTKPGDWPWHAAIYKISKATLSYICGGTLISKYHVLTAAHCVVNNGSPISPDLISVLLGKYNLRGGDNTAVDKEVHKIIVHEMFNSHELNNDIALIKMATKVEYNKYIQPACLWQSDLNSKLPKHVMGTVVGWGIDQSDELSSQLQQAQIPKVNEVTCLKSNRAFFGNLLDDTNFCAGYSNGTSACNGDSGGGFTILIEGRYYIRGIVSTAVARTDEAKCDPDQYVLFTDTEKYVSWIRTNIK